MTEQEVIEDRGNLITLLNLTMNMLKQEELNKVNSNTETTYGVLKKESVI